ncbi:MAG: RDD family protein [Candidatus Kapaibacterium sp.]
MKIRIQTTQNVELEYEVAGIGYRFIAALIDLAIFAGYYAFFIIVLLTSGFNLPDWFIYIFLAPPLPILFYPLVCEIFLEGQTVGKRAMKLKVVRTDGSQPTVSSYLLRWLFWIIEANPITALGGLGSIAVVSIVTTKYGQRIGDLAAGTTVVRMTTETDVTDVLFQPLSADYRPAWPQVVMLNDRDIGIIRQGFEAVEKGAEPEILSKIAYKVADVLEIERSKIGATEIFLKTIMNDYQYLASEE